MPLPTQPPYWVAMNQARFNNSTDCGACVEATGPSRTKQFIVVDECPANSTHCDAMEHIDTDQTGFGAIGGNGIMNSNAVEVHSLFGAGDVRIYTPSTASKFNAPITVRDHRYRIKSVNVHARQQKIDGRDHVQLERPHGRPSRPLRQTARSASPVLR